MWKLILVVTGRALRSVATVLLVIPISILLLDALIITLPVIFLLLSISSLEVQAWFADNFSLLDTVYYIIVFLGVIGIALELFFPKIKRLCVNLLADQNKIFYLFFAGMVGACVALFFYTLPLFLGSGWPYGSKESFIGTITFLGIFHIFSAQWLFVYVALDKGAAKLIGDQGSNIAP